MTDPKPEPPHALDAERIYGVLVEQIAKSLRAGAQQPFMVGVHSGGAWIAERLHRDLGLTSPLGFLSSAFHRDDYQARGLPANMKPTQLPFEVAGADLILVDDILFTGRTVRAALNELYDYGRPARVDLAVLLDRGGRELPIAATYCGSVYPLSPERAFVLAQDTQGRLSLRIE